MREKGTLGRDSYEETSRTHEAEQTYRKTGKIDPLVDPSKGGVIRLALRRFVEELNYLILPMGMPMLIESILDTTASMGDNVDRAFTSLLHLYELLKKVLPRYDLQVINGIFQDTTDQILAMRSMAEMDVKIAKQLTLMVPDRDGGDTPEDPEPMLFGGAYLTKCDLHAQNVSFHNN
jgi:hypothetical protein